MANTSTSILNELNWLNWWARPDPEPLPPDPHWEQGWLRECFDAAAAQLTGVDWVNAEA